MTAWTARLYREHANVQAAQDFCQAEPGRAEAGLRIALHVWLFYYWGAGQVSEGRYRLGQALVRAREPTVWRARGLLLAGLLAAVSGDRGAAQPLLAEGSGAVLLISLANIAGLTGDEVRTVGCSRELAALTEPGGESIRRWSSAYSLWALGVAAWRRGDLDRAAGLQQESLRLPPLAGFQQHCERQARQALGEQAFQAAYHRGLELPMDDALAYALQQPKKPPDKRPAAPAVPSGAPLTPREMQVGRLLAEGCSNKQIAARLVISRRTAEGHVEHILTKLGFTSRAQVAVWIAASQPGDDAG
jgi:non-specific serine/threonine protein kinase